MRDYGKVHTQFWASPSIKGLQDDAKMMALYLLTSQHGTIAGIFRLPDGYAMEDLGWGREKVAAVMQTLREEGFAERCDETKWVWINKHLEWNPPENPNQWKAVNKLAASVPDGCKWKKGFERVLEGFRNGKNGVPKPVAVAVAVTGIKSGDIPEGFKTFWGAWPKSSRKGGKPECLKVWLTKRLEESAAEILAHVELMKRGKQWADDQFIPAPVVYLRGAKWDGAEPVLAPVRRLAI